MNERVLFLLVLMALCTSVVRSDTAEGLLPGVDDETVAVIGDWWANQESTAVPREAAKFVFRSSRISESLLQSRASKLDQFGELGPLEVVSVSARAKSVRLIKIPIDLADSLGFQQMWLVEARVENQRATFLSKTIPAAWAREKKFDQPFSSLAISIRSRSEKYGALLVAPTIYWYPEIPSEKMGVSLGWTMLAAEGFDSSKFDLIASRNRAALSSAESSAYYQFLSAAHRVQPQASLSPKHVGAMDLLADAQAKRLIGEFVSVRVETARIQRVSTPELLESLGQDHYWEIDAFGDLKNARIRIESNDGGEPIEFNNRYPVTLTALELPEFLNRLVVENGQVKRATLMHKTIVDVDGFFYRLWSYKSAYVGGKGGDRQIGPLVVAASWRQPQVGVPKASVNMIGWVAASVFILGLLATVVYLVSVGRSDRKARSARQEFLPSEIGRRSEAKSETD